MNIIKSKILILTYILSFILIVCSILLSLSLNKAEEYNKKIKEIQNSALSIKSDINRHIAKKNEFNSMLNILEKTNLLKSAGTDLEVNKVLQILEKRAKQYNLSKLLINISTPKKDMSFSNQNKSKYYNSRNQNNKAYKVLFSQIYLSFEAIDDRYAILYLKDMFSGLPGYFSIKELQISKNDQVVGNEIPRAINFRINILWKDIKKVR